MRTFLQIAFLFVCFLGYAQKTQEIYKRAKINYNSIEDISRLDRLGLAVDHGTHKRGFFIISDFSTSEIETARNAGFSVDVLIEDSKEYFLQQNRDNIPSQRNPTCSGSKRMFVVSMAQLMALHKPSAF